MRTVWSVDEQESAPVLLVQMRMPARDPDWNRLAEDIDNTIEGLNALHKGRGLGAAKADHAGTNPH